VANIKRIFPQDDDPIFDGEFVVGLPVRSSKSTSASKPTSPKPSDESAEQTDDTSGDEADAEHEPEHGLRIRLATEEDLDRPTARRTC
jgi:hypothetical protein